VDTVRKIFGGDEKYHISIAYARKEDWLASAPPETQSAEYIDSL
jgi:hypothetical protein